MKKKKMFFLGILVILVFLIQGKSVGASKYTNPVKAWNNFGKDKCAKFHDGYFYFCTRGRTADTGSPLGFDILGYTIKFTIDKQDYKIALKQQQYDKDSGSIDVVNKEIASPDGYTYNLKRVPYGTVKSVFYQAYTKKSDRDKVDKQFSRNDTVYFTFNAILCLWDRKGSEKVNRVTISEDGSGGINYKGNYSDIFKDESEAVTGCNNAGFDVGKLSDHYYGNFYNQVVEVPNVEITPQIPNINISSYKPYWNANDLANGGINITASTEDGQDIGTVTVECLTNGTRTCLPTSQAQAMAGFGDDYTFAFYPNYIKNDSGANTGTIYQGDGTYTYRVTAVVFYNDMADYVKNEQTFTVNMDETAPTIGGFAGNMSLYTGDALDRGFFQPGSTHTFLANGIDNFSGMANLQLYNYWDYLNGGRNPLPYGHSWDGSILNATFPISDTMGVMAVATDNAGNVSTYAYTYYFDHSSPYLRTKLMKTKYVSSSTFSKEWINAQDIEDFHNDDSTFSIQALTYDEGIRLADGTPVGTGIYSFVMNDGIKDTTYVQDGGITNFSEPNKDQSTYQQIPIDMNVMRDGINDYTFTSIDHVGNVSKSTVTIKKDTLAPYSQYRTGKLDQNSNGQVTGLNYSIIIKDTTSGIDSVSWSPFEKGNDIQLLNIEKTSDNEWVYSFHANSRNSLTEIIMKDKAGNTDRDVKGEDYESPYIYVGYGKKLSGDLTNHDLVWQENEGSVWENHNLEQTEWLNHDAEIVIGATGSKSNEKKMDRIELYQGSHDLHYGSADELSKSLLEKITNTGIAVGDSTYPYFDRQDTNTVIGYLHTVSEEGISQFSVLAVSKLGMYSSVRYMVKIDKTAPTVTLGKNPDAGDGWQNQDTVVEANVTDTLQGKGEYGGCSGIKSIKIYKNGVSKSNQIKDSLIETENYIGSQDAPFLKKVKYVDKDEEPHNLVVVVTDYAGNTTQQTISVNIDKHAPDVSIQGGDTWTNQNVPVTISTMDSFRGQGINELGGCSGLNPNTLSVKKNGTCLENSLFTVIMDTLYRRIQTHTETEEYPLLSVSITDFAGNTGTAEKRIKIDKTAPTGTGSYDMDTKTLTVDNIVEQLSGMQKVTAEIYDKDNPANTINVDLNAVDTETYQKKLSMDASSNHILENASQPTAKIHLYDVAGNETVLDEIALNNYKLETILIRARDPNNVNPTFAGGDYALLKITSGVRTDKLIVTLPNTVLYRGIVGVTPDLYNDSAEANKQSTQIYIEGLSQDRTGCISATVNPNVSDDGLQSKLSCNQTITINLNPGQKESIVYLYIKCLIHAENGKFLINSKNYKNNIIKKESNVNINIEGCVLNEFRTRIRKPEGME